MFSITRFNCLCRAGGMNVLSMIQQRVSNRMISSHFSNSLGIPYEPYLKKQARDLRFLNEWIREGKVGFEECLCCGKNPKMQVETAYKPHYKCPVCYCRK